MLVDLLPVESHCLRMGIDMDTYRWKKIISESEDLISYEAADMARKAPTTRMLNF